MKRRQTLFLEERLAVVRRMLNEDTMRIKTQEQIKRFALRAINVIDGDRRAVPRKYKGIIK